MFTQELRTKIQNRKIDLSQVKKEIEFAFEQAHISLDDYHLLIMMTENPTQTVS